MPTDRRLDERISGWLEAEAPTQLPDRVLRETFVRARRTRQQGWVAALLGRIFMNRLVFGLGAAVVVVLAAAVALNGDPGRSSVGGVASPEPSATATAAPSPTATAPSPTPTMTPEGLLSEGPHTLWSLDVVMKVEIPAPGWYGAPHDGIVIKDDRADGPDGAGLIVFAGDPGGLYVYGDPCAWSTTRPAVPAATVDEVVAALAGQSSRDATAPVDVTIDGHAGKSMRLHVPEDAVFADCDQGYFASWGVEGEDPARYHQDPGQIDELWILDVDGDLVVIDAAYYEGTPRAVVDELRAIVESTTFGH